jgi:hypothetical protein
MRISYHAKQQYSLRKSLDGFPLQGLTSEEELRARLRNAKPSKYHPRKFFNGSRGIKARDITLYQDESLIYAVRDNVLITVLNVPGTDMVSDFIRESRNF